MRSFVRLLLLGTLAIAPASLSGCAGFTPLYSEHVTVNMTQIAIDVPQTRTGYFLEQDLRNGFGSDEVSTKKYTLAIKMTERHFAIGYKIDDTSSRSEITAKVGYTLTDNATGDKITEGKFSETVTYDTSQSPFTGVVSQQDAQERIAGAVSQKIQTDLAVYFRAN